MSFYLLVWMLASLRSSLNISCFIQQTDRYFWRACFVAGPVQSLGIQWGVGWGGERVLMELTDWWRWGWELGERQMINK